MGSGSHTRAVSTHPCWWTWMSTEPAPLGWTSRFTLRPTNLPEDLGAARASRTSLATPPCLPRPLRGATPPAEPGQALSPRLRPASLGARPGHSTETGSHARKITHPGSPRRPGDDLEELQRSTRA